VKIYVASSSRDLARPRRVMAALEAAGLENALDWTKDIDEAAANGWKTDREVPDDLAIRSAERDLDAIFNADAILLLVNAGGTGQWIEFGFALGLNAEREEHDPMIFVAGDSKRTIFLRRKEIVGKYPTAHTLVSRWFATDEEAIQYLIGMHENS